MKNPEILIGRKARGFKFESVKNSIQYNVKFMKEYIGKIGCIEFYDKKNKSFFVGFSKESGFYYPADQIEAHLVDDEIPTFTKEDLREAYKIGFNLIMSKSRKESDKHFERWYQKRFEPTKEEQLTEILGSSEKVSEIMELFKK